MRATHTRLSRAIPAHPIDKCVFPDYFCPCFSPVLRNGLGYAALISSFDAWLDQRRDFFRYRCFKHGVVEPPPLRTLLFAFDFFMNNLILLLLILIVNIYKTLVNVWFFRYSYFRVKWSYINDDYVEMKRRRANWRINKAYLTSFRL